MLYQDLDLITAGVGNGIAIVETEALRALGPKAAADIMLSVKDDIYSLVRFALSMSELQTDVCKELLVRGLSNDFALRPGYWLYVQQQSN